MNMTMALLTGGGLVAAGTLAGVLIDAVRDKGRHHHEKELAREARQQDRLERTYTELGIYLSHYGDWARSIHPFLGPVPTPDPMPPGERWRIETLVTNHGSPQVRQLLERWGETARKIENADIVIRMAEQSRNPGELDSSAAGSPPTTATLAHHLTASSATPPTASPSCAPTLTASHSCSAAATVSRCSGQARNNDAANAPGQPMSGVRHRR